MDWHERDRLAEEALANARFITTTGFARCDCPFCLEQGGRTDKKQSLAISVSTGWYKCWKCAVTGRIDRPEDAMDIPERAPTEHVDAPEGYMVLCEEPAKSAVSVEDARQYLRSRGLTDESVWAEVGIGCCLSGRWANRVVVPVRSPEGPWWGWVSRIWSRGVPDPYRTAPGMVLGSGVFNHAALLQEIDEPVIVVEGCFDALPYWPDAVACLGKPKAAQVGSLVGAKRPVVVVLDGDAWEEGQMLAMDLELQGQRAGYVRLPPKEDPNSVDPVWLREQVARCLS